MDNKSVIASVTKTLGEYRPHSKGWSLLSSSQLLPMWEYWSSSSEVQIFQQEPEICIFSYEIIQFLNASCGSNKNKSQCADLHGESEIKHVCRPSLSPEQPVCSPCNGPFALWDLWSHCLLGPSWTSFHVCAIHQGHESLL